MIQFLHLFYVQSQTFLRELRNNRIYMKNLRKVRFSQMNWEIGFDDKEQDEINKLAKERYGYFHCWTEEVDNSKDLPFVKKMALIEECETGKIKKIDFNLIEFIDCGNYDKENI